MSTATTSRPPAPAGRRPLLRRWWVWAGGGAVLVAVLGWLLLISPVLGVSAVTVRGERTLSAAQVRTAARIAPGTPLLRLPAGRIAARVEALPVVASASVSVSYPSTVVITVRERVAVGYVRADGSAGGPVTLVDAGGRQYATAATAPAGLPRFELPTGPTATDTGAAVAAVAAALPGGVLSRLSAIQALNPSTITLLLADGRVVLWGAGDRDADKAAVLPALLAQPGDQFDLTDPDAPVVR